MLYFSGPSRSLMPALLSVENWVPLKPVLGGVRDVAHFHYPSWTDSIKPSLQFSYNFVVINASEGSLSFQICLLISPFVTMTTVKISLGGDSLYLYCLVNKNMVGLRVRFGAPLTGLNSPAVFMLLTVRRRSLFVCLRCMSLLFHIVLVTLLCPLLFSRLR